MKDLLRAAGPISLDLGGTLLLALLMASGVPLWLSVTAGAAAQAGVIAATYVRGHRIVALQWTSLVLVLVAGASSLLMGDPRLIMLKPTIVYCAVGLSMLQRGWMTRYVPPEARQFAHSATLWFGYGWAALMFGTAAANLAVVALVPFYWKQFMLVFPIATKVALFGLQYAVTIRIVRRNGASVPSTGSTGA